MNGQFDNKVVLVIGGTAGIGLTTALMFARAGAAVVIAGRNNEAGDIAAAQIEETGADCLFQQTDVTVLAQVQSLVDKTIAGFGRLDCAFNNAGWEGTAERCADIAEPNWSKMIDIKLNGVWRGMRCQIPALLASGGGSIVNMAGNWGLTGFPAYSSYCAAAHGIMGLTKSAAMEYAGESIRINAVCPGAVDAPLLDRMTGGNAAVKKEFANQLPAGRLCTREEVAAAVLWLASDAAGYVNGTGLVLDGGGRP